MLFVKQKGEKYMFNINEVKIIVLKVGTSSLAQNDSFCLSDDFIKTLVGRIVGLKKIGKNVVLITSGAILAGMESLGLSSRPKDIIEKQRLSSIGQPFLMAKYIQSFSRYGVRVGQVLLTASDIESPVGKKHSIDLISCLLKNGDVPIINENDAVATDEIRIGDNDTLAARVGRMIKSDLVVLLSDINGLYDRNPAEPEARLIKEVGCITEEIQKMAGTGNDRGIGTGGMHTKLIAANICLNSKIPMILMNSKDDIAWEGLFSGKKVGGTLFIDKR